MLKPLSSERWTLAAAAHLLNRAGFGGTPDQIEALHRVGLDAAVARLVDPKQDTEAIPLNPPAWAHPDPDRAARLRRARAAGEDERRRMREEQQREQRRRVEELRLWWLRRMVESPRPLEEKLVLFWHGHFATSVQKVRDAWLMYRQLDLFRRHGLGKWQDLLKAVTWDPAMLIWLDQAQSRREHPNENYAREVLELFALGEGQYSEKDILETARALTGLTLNRETLEPEWRPRFHDPGLKSVLGRTGLLGPDDVILHIARHPQSARHVSGRFWRFFAQESVPAPVLDGLTREFQRCDGDIRSVLRCLFRSEAFYSSDVVRTQIKSPVHWLVSALRQLERNEPPGARALSALRELGQDLLAPPNVKGWDGGTAWINTGTLTRRQQWAAVIVEGRAAIVDQAEGERGQRLRERLQRMDRARGAESATTRVTALFSSEAQKDRSSFVTALEQRFLHSRMRPQLLDAVNEVLGDDPVPAPRAQVQAVRVVLQSTDYQLT